jgi:DNA-binding response OmpR family regulator
MERTMAAMQARQEWLLKHMGKCAVARATMVAAFRPDEDRRDLKRIVGPCEWKLIWTDTCAGAVEEVRQSSAPIIISGRVFPDGEWRDIWNRLRTHPAPPMFILASRLADDALWAEALNLGAYNLVLKPFRPEEVIRTVHGALMAWQTGQTLGTRTLAAGASPKFEV